MTEGIEAVKEVKKVIKRVREPCKYCGRIYADLVMARVSKNTKKRFIEFASEEEFSSDYGNALKFLLDFYLGRIVDGSVIAEAKADEALSQITELKNKEGGQQSPQPINLVNGKEIKRTEVKRNEQTK